MDEQEFKKVFLKCEELISSIKELNSTAFDMRVKLIELNDNKDRVESSVMTTISNELTDDGKKKYSNEASRNAELRVRLKDNESYGLILTDLVDYDRRAKEMEFLIKMQSQKLDLNKKLLDFYNSDTQGIVTQLERIANILNRG